MHDEPDATKLAADRHRLLRVLSRALDAAEAEDVLQDAYVRTLESDEPARVMAPGWLLTVARHVAIDRGRRLRWLDRWIAEHPAWSADAAMPSVEDEAARKQALTSVVAALAERLSGEDAARVLRFYYAFRPVADLDAPNGHPRLPLPVAPDNHERRRLHEFVSAAERASAAMCSRCGASGELRSFGGWAAVLCEAHRAEELGERDGSSG